MAKKKYDPLWEIIDEKIALQDGEPDIDVPCPHCYVLVHIGSDLEEGQRVTCGLCGGISQVAGGPEGRHLEEAD